MSERVPAICVAAFVVAVACAPESETNSNRRGSEADSGEGGAGASTGGSGGASVGGRGGSSGTSAGGGGRQAGGVGDQPEGGDENAGASGAGDPSGGSNGAGQGGNGGSAGRNGGNGGSAGRGGGGGPSGCVGQEIVLERSQPSSCSFALPAEARTDFNRINVRLGDTRLCRATGATCPPEGWQFSADLEVLLCDQACAASNETPNPVVVASIGCTTVSCN